MNKGQHVGINNTEILLLCEQKVSTRYDFTVVLISLMMEIICILYCVSQLRSCAFTNPRLHDDKDISNIVFMV